MMMATAIAARFSFVLVLLLGSSHNGAYAIKCGTPLTTDCLGATDIRYDPDVSNSVVDQAFIWKKLEGFFVGEGSVRVNTAVPFGHIPASPDPSGIIASLPYYEFLNRTYDGSRIYEYSFNVAPLLPDQVGSAVAFATTTYEKDGTYTFFPAVVESSENEADTTAPIIPSTLRTYPVDDNTAYSSSEVTGIVNGVTSALRVCLDVNCDRFDETVNVYIVVNGTILRVFATEVAYMRVSSAEEWVQAIYDRYNESNIPLDKRLDPTVYPCSQGLCPTEEQWCQTDPNCSESPYQEPPASVRGGVIAGFTIAGVVILVIVLYLIHRHLLALQAQRYRTVFAKRIADTIQVRGSMRALPPDALVEEFNRIDAGVKDGKLSKEEMWEFISSGKAGEIDRKDFDALFAAIDLDGSGNIDFLEFCAFMGKCSDEYRAARVDRGSIVARRVSAASTAFVKVPDDEAEADA